MALIDARQRRWIVAAALLGVAATAGYVGSRRGAGHELTGSSLPGLWFGIAAAALMLFEVALNLRKRVPTWRIGRAETWLKGHIWLGLLIVPLVCFHSSFRFHGTLAVALSLLALAVVLSGIYGLALQQFVPRLMAAWAPGETIYEQIPHVVRLLGVEAYETAAAVCGPIAEAADEKQESERIHADPKLARRVAAYRPAEVPHEGSDPLRRFYLEMVRPFLRADGRRGPLADAATAERTVEGVCRGLPPSLHDVARDLSDIAAERRDLAVQRRLHHWLHGWLLLHVPLTAALLVLLLAHVVVALRYSY
jgi:hypothetical protein